MRAELFLSVGEAARLAGVTPDTIRTATRRHRLRVAATTGTRVRLFTKEDILAWLSNRRPPFGRPRTSAPAA